MNRFKALILDLDDTIYPTKSLDKDQVQGFFDALDRYNDSVSTEDLQKAKQEMWIHPIHVVARRYEFSQRMYEQSMDFFDREFKFSIRPFPDYQSLADLKLPLFLVTTGPTKLQEAKIKSLGIENHFKEIIIDDPMAMKGGKVAAFQSLIDRHQLTPSAVLVIGDNPDSEIAAAKDLNIPYALIDRNNAHQNTFNSFDSIFERLLK
ncbi:MAG: HAD family hydrolase [Marinoscillum sp.]